jgi:hypothetical protein
VISVSKANLERFERLVLWQWVTIRKKNISENFSRDSLLRFALYGENSAFSGFQKNKEESIFLGRINFA